MLEHLATRLRSLGFVCFLDHFEAEDGEPAFDRVTVGKPKGMQGNRVEGTAVWYTDDDDVDRELDGPQVSISAYAVGYEFVVAAAIPWSPGGYVKKLASIDEVYEEVLHYFFDTDSRMSLERTFVAWTGGRPPGA